ncbi:hypothetical protein PoB_001129600 [Plakobranchus ocellatus]|uniref:Uncharacterized protein n=1 Tax=Plakobranchus ocellatus TaxID=259542 RepID=A0AAV3YQY3_9GAST|nr:hypothetical protein PoB_001129600 [Plakobranchus ocellatus]
MPKTEILNQFLVDSLLAYGVQEEVFLGLDDMKEEKTFKWANGSELMVPGFYVNFDHNAGIFRTDGSRTRKAQAVCGPGEWAGHTVGRAGTTVAGAQAGRKLALWIERRQSVRR